MTLPSLWSHTCTPDPDQCQECLRRRNIASLDHQLADRAAREKRAQERALRDAEDEARTRRTTRKGA